MHISFVKLIGNPLLEVPVVGMHHHDAEFVPLGRKDIKDLNDVGMVESLERTHFLYGLNLFLDRQKPYVYLLDNSDGSMNIRFYSDLA